VTISRRALFERIGFGENWYVHILAGCG